MHLKRFSFTISLFFLLAIPVLAADQEWFPFGIPGNIPPSDVILHRDIYTLCNNGQTKFADWVAYMVTAQSCNKNGKTARIWKRDPDLPTTDTLAPSDYKGANKALHVDRGHQAPLASFQGTEDWEATNYLSNITPQKSTLNQGAWKRVEDSVRQLAQTHTVYVITGPLYERETEALPNASTVHIPSGYWKIIAIKDANPKRPLRVIGFIFEQDTPRSANEMGYTATVDQIETRTGLDFFPNLPDHIETVVEECNSLNIQ